MAYTVKTFDAIIDELDETHSWLQEVLQLPDGAGRLGEIQTEIARIKDLVESGIAEEELFRQVDQVTAYHSWIDALGFVRIWQGLSGLSDQKLPRRLLRRANRGSLSPEQESLDDSDARNVFFQLEYAADLSTKGIKIRGFDDVEFEFEGTLYLAECKRLWSDRPRAVQRNIDKAASQLVRHLDAVRGKRARGLVVIALESIAGLKSALPMEAPVAIEADVIGYTRRVAGAFMDVYGESLVGLNGRIIAAVIVGKMPIHTLSDNTFGPAFIPTIVPLVPRGSMDYRRLRRLARTLNA